MKNKIKLIILLIACLISGGLIAFKGFILPEYTLAEVNLNKWEIYPTFDPIKDWVLKEVYKSGLNPYKAYLIIDCESKWNPEAMRINNGSIDRGLWQINSKFHKEVSNSCSFNYQCSTREAIKIIKKSGWTQWVCSK